MPMLIIEIQVKRCERTETNDLGSKLAAQILLAARTGHRIVIPTREEWIGIGLLERDDELKREKAV